MPAHLHAMTMSPNRTPAGTPAGGEFASSTRAESPARLEPPVPDDSSQADAVLAWLGIDGQEQSIWTEPKTLDGRRAVRVSVAYHAGDDCLGDDVDADGVEFECGAGGECEVCAHFTAIEVIQAAMKAHPRLVEAPRANLSRSRINASFYLD